MRIERLKLTAVRSIAHAELCPGAGLNLLTGENGAGKTSVLEALHLLGYGRSFLGRVRDGLIREGEPALEVYAEWQVGDGRRQRAGLRHAGSEWQARLNGEPVAQLGDLCAAFAVVTFEPGSHALLGGSGDPRRRFLDWGLFHVEPDYLPLWRRYMRALRQRNRLLKLRQAGAQLEAWDQELVAAAEPLQRHRQAYVAALLPHLQAACERLLPDFGLVALELQPGWKQEAMSLADAVLLGRERDLALGHTGVGPHRADWRVAFVARPQRQAYSRGQAKLVALACLLAQARHLAEVRGEWPLVLLDDFASELDARHRRRVLDELRAAEAQVFMTGTDLPAELDGVPATLFHVEHGTITVSAYS
ncbi:DNA replication/repair protein RecF [Luteimonas sp. e5]